jgi:hypothetical protein
LEARDRVGGRVHSYVGPFGAPVDLGASLITGEALRWRRRLGAAEPGRPLAGGLDSFPPSLTRARARGPCHPGTAPEVKGSRRPDPSSILCRQLGVKLHPLESDLPLYDWRGGEPGAKIPKELDEAVDRWGGAGRGLKLRGVELLGVELRGGLTSWPWCLAARGPRVMVWHPGLRSEPPHAPSATARARLRDGLLDAARARVDAADDPKDMLHSSLGGALREELDLWRAKGAAAAAAAATGAGGDADMADANGAGVKEEAGAAKPEGGDAEMADAPPADAKPEAADAKPEAADAKPEAQPEAGESKATDAKAEAKAKAKADAAAGGEVTDDMLRVLDWHWANLEYGCSACLDDVSPVGCGEGRRGVPADEGVATDPSPRASSLTYKLASRP